MGTIGEGDGCLVTGARRVSEASGRCAEELGHDAHLVICPRYHFSPAFVHEKGIAGSPDTVVHGSQSNGHLPVQISQLPVQTIAQLVDRIGTGSPDSMPHEAPVEKGIDDRAERPNQLRHLTYANRRDAANHPDESHVTL